ncbi:Bromodomain associated-domain-containing protein [Zychaea mexicana]|uniref:Bromodomain associated-domain-containing protein n=1 Tax=Zychaea mexicana TaxID=64656 RepID=UPI0022FF19AC|nr:Bromodomain associated-domain-containing protein [Zychaea mexicana]KAI9469317.1 Bromodomain associated-domain-containing protein [Zychaea mexicana]
MPDSHFSKSDFARDANCKAISLITREAGFESIQRSALEKLSNVLELYLENLLSRTHKYAELASRTKPNYHDILRTLEESGIQLSSFSDYMNQSRQNRHLLTIPTATEQPNKSENNVQFLASDDENDEDEDDDDNSSEKKGASSQFELPEYVPDHLPKFPSRHSFRQTPVYIHRPDDPQRVRELNSQQSRIVEENLKRLMSAENQLLRRAERSRDDLMDITIPIVNYEGALQRRKRVKRARSEIKEPDAVTKPSSHETAAVASTPTPTTPLTDDHQQQQQQHD